MDKFLNQQNKNHLIKPVENERRHANRTQARCQKQENRNFSNQAFQRILQEGLIRAKLNIAKPEDEYEREANRVEECAVSTGFDGSNCIMKMNDKNINQMNINNENDRIEEKSIQAKNTSIQNSDISADIDSEVEDVKTGGEPLPDVVRYFFEPRFQRDFSNIRIHKEKSAMESAEKLKAKAFTIGSHIIFGKEQYEPYTTSGKRLIAHELAHVVQQKASTFLALQRESNGKPDAPSPSPVSETGQMSKAIAAKDFKEISRMLNDKEKVKENYRAFFAIANGYSMFDILQLVVGLGASLLLEHIGEAIGIANKPRFLAAIKIIQFTNKNEVELEETSSYVSVLPEDQRKDCIRFLGSRFGKDILDQLDSPRELTEVRNKFREKYDELGEERLYRIQTAIATAAPKNHKLQIAFYKHYNDYILFDNFDVVDPSELEGKAAITSGDVTKIGDEALNKSAEVLGPMLMHELIHTRHIKGTNIDEVNWQEGEGYGVEAALGGEDPERVDVIKHMGVGVRCTKDPKTGEKTCSESKADFAFGSKVDVGKARAAYIISYVTLVLLNKASEGDILYSDHGNPLSKEKLNRQQIQDLISEYLTTKIEKRSQILSDLINWVRSELERAKNLDGIIYKDILPPHLFAITYPVKPSNKEDKI